MSKVLYLCDGLACNDLKKTICAKHMIESDKSTVCIHTSKENHSIKKILGKSFPETIFINHPSHDITVEEFEELETELLNGITKYDIMKAYQILMERTHGSN